MKQDYLAPDPGRMADGIKQEYIPPELHSLGSVEELTLGGSSGRRLDADFSAGTPFGDLTFS